MNTQTLSFGKFKGQRFCDTPDWYQQWLQKQKWFNKATVKKETPLHQKSLKGWDGHGSRGQAIYEAKFEEEMREAEKHDSSWSWMYLGVD